MTTNQIKHLEMIQRVISRMANNSLFFKLSGVVCYLGFIWTHATLLIILPLFAFWGLDAYFLKQERLFRKIYDSVRLKSDTDFSMNPSKFIESWGKIVFSKSILWFYLPLIFIGVVYSIVT